MGHRLKLGEPLRALSALRAAVVVAEWRPSEENASARGSATGRPLTRDEFIALRALHSNPLARLAEDVAETLAARQLVCPADGGMTLTGAGRAEYLSELIRAFKFGVDDPADADWPSKQRH